MGLSNHLHWACGHWSEQTLDKLKYLLKLYKFAVAITIVVTLKQKELVAAVPFFFAPALFLSFPVFNRPEFRQNSFDSPIISEDTPLGSLVTTVTAEDLDEGVNGMVNFALIKGSGYLCRPVQISSWFYLLSLRALQVLRERDKVIK